MTHVHSPKAIYFKKGSIDVMNSHCWECGIALQPAAWEPFTVKHLKDDEIWEVVHEKRTNVVTKILSIFQRNA